MPPPFLKKLFTPTVFKALVALAAAIGAAYGLSGCSASLTPAQQARQDAFECQVAAFAPLVEPALDAAELVRDLQSGKGDLGVLVRSLGATAEEIQALVDALNACEPAPAPLPEGKAT